MSAADSLANPILNSPYEPPERHFEIGPHGPTGEIQEGRRPSESFIPIPVAKKGRRREQQALDFDATGERREQNTLINDIRREVERWRAQQLERRHAHTPASCSQHWAAAPTGTTRSFCQREAAETAIFLTEVGGPSRQRRLPPRLEPENELHNDGLPRVGAEDGDGHGQDRRDGDAHRLADDQQGDRRRTTRASPSASSWSRPGSRSATGSACSTPSDDDNYYGERDLVPPDLWDALLQAADRDHQLPRVPAPRRQGDPGSRAQHPEAAARRQAKRPMPFQETADQWSRRVLRDLRRPGKGEIVVLNDEAHHCYQDKPLEHPDDEAPTRRTRSANARGAGLVPGPQAIATQGRHQGGLRPLGDAVLPEGLRLQRGLHLPVDRQRLLADGRDRVGHRQGPAHPSRRRRRPATSSSTSTCGTTSAAAAAEAAPQEADAATDWVPPETLEGALRSLYRSYEQRFARYESELGRARRAAAGVHRRLPEHGRVQAVYDWIAGER